MNLRLHVPFEACFILWQLNKAGFDGYVVGGAVRDLVIQAINKLQPKQNSKFNQSSFAEDTVVSDYDFTTDATPNQIQEIFTDSYYTNEFGTVGVSYDNLMALITNQGTKVPKQSIKTRLTKSQLKPNDSIIDLAQAKKIHPSLQAQADSIQKKKQAKVAPPPFEITTYRSEGVYSDYRRPDQVSWGNSIEEDLERRDFTINAMALKIDSKFLQNLFSAEKIKDSLIKLKPDQYTIVDLHQGMKDLAEQQIRTVRNPDQRFQEDALRMLRAIRLACQLHFEIEPLTLASIKHHADLIKKISIERVRQEFLHILTTDQPDRGIQLLHETGLLAHIMPELSQGIGVEQGGHHDTDVWTHQLAAVKNCPVNDPIIRLAALLHDIGKPKTARIINDEITFYNHEVVSSRMAARIANRLKLSNEQREKLLTLVRQHMFHYQPQQTDAAIRRLIKRVGLEYIDDLLAVREADRLGSGARKTSWRLEELKERIIEQLNQPLAVTDLAIDGHDLMTEFDLKPSPKIGQILDQLLAEVLESPDLNTKENLLEQAKEILKQ